MKTLEITAQTVAVVSDLHLGTGTMTEAQRIVLNQMLYSGVPKVVIWLGDFFDLNEDVTLTTTEKAFLESVIHHANRSVFVAGNHDDDLFVAMNRLFPHIKVTDGVVLNESIFLCHGHQFDSSIRNWPKTTDAFAVVGNFIAKVAPPVYSVVKAVVGMVNDGSEELMEAKKLLDEGQYSTVILGHSHVDRVERWVKGGVVETYVNAGSQGGDIGERTVVFVRGKKVELKHY